MCVCVRVRLVDPIFYQFDSCSIATLFIVVVIIPNTESCLDCSTLQSAAVHIYTFVATPVLFLPMLLFDKRYEP